MMVIKDINRISFFQDLDNNEYALLKDIFTVEHFEKDEEIFHQESKAEYFYILSSGKVVIRYKPYDGPALVVARIQSGGVFGWSAMLRRDVYTSDAIADEKSIAFRVKGSELLALCAKHPESGAVIMQRLANIISERLEGTHAEILKIFRNGMDLSNECWKRMIENE
ncbi:MAG: cyclic nucleotide-binding domain-containing protein [Anaerolineaceae bacterium]|nr:cyclic nucleotide-binding domain-containing protein [Anaerolineaceae bacterium]